MDIVFVQNRGSYGTTRRLPGSAHSAVENRAKPLAAERAVAVSFVHVGEQKIPGLVVDCESEYWENQVSLAETAERSHDAHPLPQVALVAMEKSAKILVAGQCRENRSPKPVRLCNLCYLGPLDGILVRKTGFEQGIDFENVRKNALQDLGV